MLTPLDIEAAFLDAAAGRGLVIRHLVADGRLHRCDAEGRGGKGDGAYLLHLDGVPNGAFMDWRDGRGWEKWKADAAAVLTPAERAALKDKAERQRREREDQKLRHQAAAREQAIAMLDRSMPADEQHPYLARKRVKPSGIHQDGETLLIPTRDAAGWVRNLQRIWPDGTKRYLQGGPVTGCFLGIGGERGAPVCIAEGYATAATIREATGWPAAVAFDAGNLAPVALSLRSKCASARLVLAADDDWLTKGNPGLSKARNAAEAVGAALVLPRFGQDRQDRDTDFNDMAARLGIEAVKAQFEGV